ncbi:hypothetical protein [Lysinibacillus telephonicus]|uniref:hypothetical protein n=1 Tax=Lysinibacillus telephonicus TaxID=1714840 RepID=UPI003B9E4C7F
MNHSIVKKAKLILEDIRYGLDLAKNWDEDNFDYFYKYFSHTDIEVRKYSLLVFAAGIGNWLSGSATIFVPYLNDSFTPGKRYIFEDYIKSFIDNKQKVQADFPAIYNDIMITLLELEKQKKFDSIVQITNIDVINNLQKLLNDTDKKTLKYHSYNNVLKEAGLNTMFE